VRTISIRQIGSQLGRAALTLLAMLVLGCGGEQAPELKTATADTLYFGGDILTMEGTYPAYVEALAVSDGRILDLGDKEKLNQYLADHTRQVDLQGKTLIPGFFDSHSHLSSVGMKLATVNLDAEPAGIVTSIDDIVEHLKNRLENQPPAAGEWLIGMGYDNGMLAEKRQPNREDLDRVSREIPIIIIHFSMHMAVLNSKALELEGISADTENPPGGHIHRQPGSRKPNGLLEETAMRGPLLKILTALGDGSSEGGKTFIERGLEVYAREGFTTVIEGAATPQQIGALRKLAAGKRLMLDVIALEFFETASVEQVAEEYSPGYQHHFRVGGGKIVLDGGSPGRTAYLRAPYYTPTPGQVPDYRGYPTIEDQALLNQLVNDYYRYKTPVYIHALGDAALDMGIAAVAHAESRIEPPHDKRTQFIHVQQVQEDQMQSLSQLDISLTFQVAHNYYFGDYHRSYIYGPERTRRLNPINSALQKGISSSIHHDAPVHPVDQLTLIWSAVNRSTRSGAIIGPGERITPYQALQASTINAAFQFFEEDSKGSLVKGKLADLVILDKNPLKVPRDRIKDIKIRETIKDGSTVWR
jgi:predicted amidohydrolase YtcJ